MSKTILEQFNEFIEQMSASELQLLLQQVQFGEIKQLVQKRIRDLENPTLVCPVCEQSVSEQKDVVLHFGPEGFRQKARFCGHDCLEYFLQERKEQTKALNSFQDS